MGQFKPMVKMNTTEPSVELKLKKGGSATFKRMHSEGAKEGFKPVKKMNGGVMGALSRTPTPTTPMGNPTAARAMASKVMSRMPSTGGSQIPPTRRPTMPLPGKPKLMTGSGGATELPGTYDPDRTGGNRLSGPMNPGPMPPPPTGRGGPVGVGGLSSGPMRPPPQMKKGGSTSAQLKKHADMPASKAHKGLKTGGIAKSTKPGGYMTGGVVDGQGGFKKGGSVPASGIIKTMTKKTTKVVGAKPDRNSAPTGDVKMSNAGGYKKGGATKKHFATGGAVNNSGHAVAMPKKAPSKPVAISELSGTFKRGGRVS